MIFLTMATVVGIFFEEKNKKIINRSAEKKRPKVMTLSVKNVLYMGSIKFSMN
jgi:hypothetical protein